MHTPKMIPKTIQVLGMAIIMLAIATSLVAGSMWYERGGRIEAVQTTSMEPAILKGDAVILTHVPFSNLATGDIVTYQNPADIRLSITHRVISIDKKAGWIVSQGDSLTKTDLPVSHRLIKGRVTAVAPRLGIFMDELHKPLGLLLFIYLPAATIMLAEIRRLIYHPPIYRYAGYSR